jgi:hypothetical protein
MGASERAAPAELSSLQIRYRLNQEMNKQIATARAADLASELAANKLKEASMKQTSESIAKVSTQTAELMGNAAANAAMGVANAWHTAVGAIIKDIIHMAIQWIEKHIIMAEAAALVHEVSTKGIVGLITGMAAIAAIAAIGAGLEAAVGGSGGKGGSVSAGGISSASGSASQSVSGGSAVATAQQSVANNIVVNLPVQAMDLSSISDTQMKALAFRIGRALQEAGATGQMSLA